MFKSSPIIIQPVSFWNALNFVTNSNVEEVVAVNYGDLLEAFV
jgi:hypothetical protein